MNKNEQYDDLRKKLQEIYETHPLTKPGGDKSDSFHMLSMMVNIDTKDFTVMINSSRDRLGEMLANWALQNDTHLQCLLDAFKMVQQKKLVDAFMGDDPFMDEDDDDDEDELLKYMAKGGEA